MSEAQEILDALKGAKTVAVVRLGSIGDVLATLPFAWLLREILPARARIAWIAHPGPAEILRGVAAIDEIHTVPRSAILPAIPAWRRALRPAGIDAAIDLHGNLKSGIVTLLTGARVRIGLHRRDCREHWNPLFTNFKLPPLSSGNKTRRALEAARFLGVKDPGIRFGLEFGAEEAEAAARVIGALSPGKGPVTVLQLGRPEDVRAWPALAVRDLSLHLLSKDRRVLIIGGPAEVETAISLKRILGDERPGLRYEVGTLTLRELGALCQALAGDPAGAHTFVGPDSGSLHLAAACGLRTIGLHGPQDPARTAPAVPAFRALYHPEAAECIPCGHRECSHEVPSFCMESILPREVLEAITGEKPAESPPAPSREGAAPAAADGPAAAGKRKKEALQVGSLLLMPPLLLLLNASIRGIPVLGPGIGIPLASAAISSLLLLLTYLHGRWLGSHRAGVLSGLSILLMQGFLKLAWLPLPEVLFGLLAFLSLLLYHRGDQGRGKLRWAGIPLSAMAALLAFAMKGFPGLLIPAAAVLAFHLGEKKPGKLLRPKLLIPALLVLGLGLSIETRLVDLPESEVPWAYLFWIVGEGFPLTLLLPFALFAHLKTRRYREDLGFADRRWRFPKAALGGGLAILMVFSRRDPSNLAPLLPLMAILIAAWIDRRWDSWFPPAAGPASPTA